MSDKMKNDKNIILKVSEWSQKKGNPQPCAQASRVPEWGLSLVRPGGKYCLEDRKGESDQ